MSIYLPTTPCSTKSAGRCWQGRSQPRPGRGLHRGPGPGPGRSVGLASSRRWPGRRQRWPGPRYPPGVQLCGGPAQGAPWAKAAVDRAWARRGPGRLSLGPRPGRRQRSIGPGHAVDQGGSARDVGLGGGSVEDLGPHVARTPYMSRCSFLRSCDHSARGNLSLSAVVARLDVSYM